MMSGKPIIYGVEARNNDVNDAGCGITIEPQNAAAVKEAAEMLRAMPLKAREEMGQRGKDWVLANCEYGELAKKFLQTLKGKQQ